MSRHRGAKHRRRYELLGGISLLSPEYLLSVERWPFHSEPPDHYDLLFRTCSRRHARSQAGLCHCTNLLMSDQISQPSCSSVTLWEETAPVKLPTRHCPQPGSRVYVRTPAIKGWYFKGGSTQTGVHASKPPTYPTHQGPVFSVKL